MTDIDWSKAPEGATHWDSDCDCFCCTDGYWDDGDWNFDQKQEAWGTSRYIPRPAQHRDWSDPAMWFDAPENFDQVRVDVRTGVLFYCGFVCDGLAVAHAPILGQESDVYDTKASELVACRPNQKQTIESIDAMDDLNCPKCKNTMTPCYNGEGFLRIWWCQICDHTDKAIGRERLIRINKP